MRCYSGVTVVCFSLRLALEAGVEEDWKRDLRHCVVIWVYICMEPWPCLDPCGELIIPLQSRYDLSLKVSMELKGVEDIEEISGLGDLATTKDDYG